MPDIQTDTATSPTDASWNSIIKGAGQLLGEGKEVSTDLKRSGEQQRAIVSKILESTPPQAPEIAPPQPAPQPTDRTSPLQAFGSFASALAIFGGLLTRQPLKASLRAATGAINATKQADNEAAQRAYDEWKIQSEYADKLSRWQIDRYKMAMQQYGANQEQLFGALRALSAEDQNEVMRHGIATGDLRVVSNILSDWQRVTDDHKLAVANLDKIASDRLLRFPIEEAAKDYKKALLSGTPAEIEAARRKMLDAQRDYNDTVRRPEIDPKKIAFEQFLKEHPNANFQELSDAIRKMSPSGADMNPDAIQAMAKLIAEGKMAPLSSFALRTNWGPLVMAEVQKINPSYTGTEYGQHQTAARAFGTGRQGDAIRSMNVSIAHLDTLSELADALQSGNTQAINRISQEVAVQTGQSAPTNFDAARMIIGQEVVKAIIGGGGGVTERLQAAENINRAQSPDQLKGVIQTTKKLLAGQLGGLKRQYEHTTGFDDFEELLSPEAKRELQGIGTTGAPSRPANVPTDAKWSPSQRSWWWQIGNDWFSAPGD